MKVTIVTAYFAPEITPVTHLYADLAADFVAYGAEVTVVTQMPNRGLSDEQRADFAGRTDEITPEGYRIVRVGGGREGAGMLRRGLHFLSGTAALYRAAKNIPTDVYLLGSMPPFLGYVGAKLSKRARTVYILQDIFPDSMLLMGKLTERHPVTRVFRRMERISYAKNNRFITLSEDMAQTLRERGIASERIDVIGNWADVDVVQPIKRADNPLFDELQLDRNDFYAVYAGTLGVLQCPDLLLDAAALAPKVQFVILGGGALLPHIRARIEQERPQNVRLFPLVPVERVSQAYSLGDVALVPLAAGTTKIATPSKTWTAMAAARPVVLTAEAESAWAKSIAGADAGCVCPPGDAAALAEVLGKLAETPQRCEEMGRNARQYVRNVCKRGEATRRYYEVLQKEN